MKRIDNCVLNYGQEVKVIIDHKYNQRIHMKYGTDLHIYDIIQFEDGENFVVKEIVVEDEELTIYLYSASTIQVIDL